MKVRTLVFMGATVFNFFGVTPLKWSLDALKNGSQADSVYVRKHNVTSTHRHVNRVKAIKQGTHSCNFFKDLNPFLMCERASAHDVHKNHPFTVSVVCVK